jgi:hypothetical protein
MSEHTSTVPPDEAAAFVALAALDAAGFDLAAALAPAAADVPAAVVSDLVDFEQAVISDNASTRTAAADSARTGMATPRFRYRQR